MDRIITVKFFTLLEIYFAQRFVCTYFYVPLQWEMYNLQMFSVFESLEIILMAPFVSVKFPEVFPELYLNLTFIFHTKF